MKIYGLVLNEVIFVNNLPDENGQLNYFYDESFPKTFSYYMNRYVNNISIPIKMEFTFDKNEVVLITKENIHKYSEHLI